MLSVTMPRANYSNDLGHGGREQDEVNRLLLLVRPSRMLDEMERFRGNPIAPLILLTGRCAINRRGIFSAKMVQNWNASPL